MAVPGRRNGMMEEDDEDEAPEGLFDEEGLVVDINTDTPPHLRALAEAAQLGNVDALRQALDNLSGSIDEPVEDGDTALHLTCLYGYLPCVQLLLERGASLEAKDEDGAIPIHDACAGGFTDIVQLLINFANNSDCVKRMLQTVDVEGDTVSGTGTKLFNFFLFLIRIIDLLCTQPLHHAARGEHVDVVRLLLAAGASPTTTNIYGKTPVELSDPDTEARGILEAADNTEMPKDMCFEKTSELSGDSRRPCQSRCSYLMCWLAMLRSGLALSGTT
ncbi:Ankyrin repeat [Macleaya cordata]|uniref:Ankyrin repeat n=1 Tax=Macleaya cordata TaxID=56857 RepID=A0A200R5H7_MACCD|nr:Ankyrin repeat [Macleaya cordata]